MAEYKVVFARSARRELEGLEASIARRIISRVEPLTTNPRPPGCVNTFQLLGQDEDSISLAIAWALTNAPALTACS